MSGMFLIHGDCLEEMKNIPDGSVDMVLADPPYKMTKQGKSCRPNYMRSGMGENLFSGELPPPEKWMSLCYNVLSSNSHFYVFANLNSIFEFVEIAKQVGFKLHNMISMIKDTNMPNRWYLKYTEYILFFRKGKAKPINDMTSRDYCFVEMPTQKKGKLHITQKPLSLINTLILNSSNENDVVLDCFMGSGTTGVACLNLNRNFIGIELEKEYFDIACKRLNYEG